MKGYEPHICNDEIQGAGFFAESVFLGDHLKPTYGMSNTSCNSAKKILKYNRDLGISSLLEFAISSNPKLNKGIYKGSFKSAHIYLITETNEIYLLHHIDRGNWRGPGGNIERNEKPLDALKREFSEEVFGRNHGRDNAYSKDNFDTFCDTYNYYDTTYRGRRNVLGARLFVGVLKPETKHLLPISVYPDY